MSELPTIPATISDAAARLAAGELTSVELLEHLIARWDALDADLGVFLHRCDELAVDAARAADRDRLAGRASSPLHGIPLALKDILCTADQPTTAQSRVLLERNHMLRYDAASVARLRESSAVLVGKTTTMEFARGRPDPTEPFPVPRNPWDRTRWAGGSSSGTASGVAAGLFLGGLGTDTGGSIRLPAANCGVTGLKPTFGSVSLHGCIPLARSLDTVGPIARSATDCRLIFDAIAERPTARPRTPLRPERLVIKVDRAGGPSNVDPIVWERVDAALEVLGAHGATVVEQAVPRFSELVIATDVISSAQAFALHRRTLQTRGQDYARPTRLTLLEGATYSAADLELAFTVLERGRAAIAEHLTGDQVVISPTTPRGADPVDDLDNEAGAPRPYFTRVWNGLGSPALSVPCGFTTDGLPVAMQIIGPAFAEDLVLSVGELYQSLTDWHLRIPATAVGSSHEQ